MRLGHVGILAVTAALCLAGIEGAAGADDLPPVASRPIHRLSGWLRGSPAAVPRHAPASVGLALPRHGHMAADPSAGYGYSMGLPAYHWGYFGAKARPYLVTHGSYHGDTKDWSFRRGD